MRVVLTNNCLLIMGIIHENRLELFLLQLLHQIVRKMATFVRMVLSAIHSARVS